MKNTTDFYRINYCVLAGLVHVREKWGRPRCCLLSYNTKKRKLAHFFIGFFSIPASKTRKLSKILIQIRISPSHCNQFKCLIEKHRFVHIRTYASALWEISGTRGRSGVLSAELCSQKFSAPLRSLHNQHSFGTLNTCVSWGPAAAYWFLKA